MIGSVMSQSTKHLLAQTPLRGAFSAPPRTNGVHVRCPYRHANSVPTAFSKDPPIAKASLRTTPGSYGQVVRAPTSPNACVAIQEHAVAPGLFPSGARAVLFSTATLLVVHGVALYMFQLMSVESSCDSIVLSNGLSILSVTLHHIEGLVTFVDVVAGVANFDAVLGSSTSNTQLLVFDAQVSSHQNGEDNTVSLTRTT